MAREVEREYIDTGKVQLVYVDFVVHEDALLAAEAAHCAGEQDSFWEYHDKIFEEQGKRDYTAENLKAFAEELGLETEPFNACLEENRYREFVIAQTQQAQQLGLEGTPTFLVNQQLIPGLVDFEQLSQIIEEELAKPEEESTVTPTP